MMGTEGEAKGQQTSQVGVYLWYIMISGSKAFSASKTLKRKQKWITRTFLSKLLGKSELFHKFIKEIYAVDMKNLRVGFVFSTRKKK